MSATSQWTYTIPKVAGDHFTFTAHKQPAYLKGVETPPYWVILRFKKDLRINERLNIDFVLHLLLFGWQWVLAGPVIVKDPKFKTTIVLEMLNLRHMLANESTAKDEFAAKCRKGDFNVWIQELACAVTRQEASLE